MKWSQVIVPPKSVLILMGKFALLVHFCGGVCVVGDG